MAIMWVAKEVFVEAWEVIVICLALGGAWPRTTRALRLAAQARTMIIIIICLPRQRPHDDRGEFPWAEMYEDLP